MEQPSDGANNITMSNTPSLTVDPNTTATSTLSHTVLQTESSNNLPPINQLATNDILTIDFSVKNAINDTNGLLLTFSVNFEYNDGRPNSTLDFEVNQDVYSNYTTSSIDNKTTYTSVYKPSNNINALNYRATIPYSPGTLM